MIRPQLLIPSAKLLIGAICVVIGFNLLTRRGVFVGRVLSTTGMVVGLDVINEETRSIVVRFTMRTGESRDAKVLTSGKYEVEEQATILYDPADPLDVKIQAIVEHWLLLLDFIAIGVVLLAPLW